MLYSVLLFPALILSAPPQKKMPEPPREDLVETLHGYTVRDPFRGLESMERASEWVDAQNAHTDAYMAKHTRPAVAKRLGELFEIGFVGGPSFAGPNIFFTRKQGEQQQATLYVKRGEGKAAPLVDPNRIDRGGQVALDWYFPSRDGGLVAYGLSRAGDEVSTLRIIEVATGAHLSDEIPFTRACTLSWLPNGGGFFYTRNPGREAYDRHVYFHALGADPAKDERVMGPERLTDRADWPTLSLSDDGRYLSVVRYMSWSNSTLHILDRHTKRWTDIAPEMEGVFSVPVAADGHFWMSTTHGKALGRVVKFAAGKAQQGAWVEVIGEDEWPLEGFSLTPDGLLTQHLVNAVSRISWQRRDGAEKAEVPLPVKGSVRALVARHDDPRVLVGFDSVFFPPTLLRGESDGAAPVLETLVQVESDFDASAYTVEQVEYPSYDGTQVPMFVIHRKDLKRDGSHKLLLYGYGGFTVSLTPGFARNVLFWLEQGGVYAVANLRGGAEKGEAWHKAGMLDRKFQVFSDFEYAMRYLHREGYTRPDRLAVLGGSNGGLLVGAAVTRVPHLFRAGVAKVGLHDMVRYHKFPPAELWVDEYGSADDPEQTGYLWAYSPYHQVIDGVRYPAVLASAAENDTRVSWVHTAKFVARLQEANASDRPVLMRFERAAGHGAGKATRAITAEYVETYLFLLSQLGAK